MLHGRSPVARDSDFVRAYLAGHNAFVQIQSIQYHGVQILDPLRIQRRKWIDVEHLVESTENVFDLYAEVLFRWRQLEFTSCQQGDLFLCQSVAFRWPLLPGRPFPARQDSTPLRSQGIRGMPDMTSHFEQASPNRGPEPHWSLGEVQLEGYPRMSLQMAHNSPHHKEYARTAASPYFTAHFVPCKCPLPDWQREPHPPFRVLRALRG